MSVLINAYCTRLDPPSMQFPHALSGKCDRDNPELSKHLHGFIGYVVGRGEQQMTQTKYHLMRHIQRVKHHFSLTVDDHDLHFRLHWAVRQARLDGKDGVKDVDAGVILERHHALNWLVRFEDADWDDVDTPT